ncbi:MAG: tetratricopeptide repeat protein [Candidatus Omnitrophica bacterium]|nr:tetratricopeptide repeat protein [Candidatus Omnitrophota bacterium]
MDTVNEFARLRAGIDEAITFGELAQAKALVKKGLHRAEMEERLGEREYFLGQFGILKGDYEQAIEHFDRAVRFNPSDGAAYNDRALCMVETGDVDEAFYYFDKGIEVEPGYATVYHNKGWLLNKTGKHREAVEHFYKCLSLDPNRAVTYENLGNALYHLNDYRASLAAYKNALRLLKSRYPHIRKQIAAEIQVLEEKLRVR